MNNHFWLKKKKKKKKNYKHQIQIQIYFVTISMITGGDEGTILVIVIEPSLPL